MDYGQVGSEMCLGEIGLSWVYCSCLVKGSRLGFTGTDMSELSFR
jgi:hypothetical protein